MPFDEHLVDVVGLDPVEGPQAEVVNDEQVGTDEPAKNLVGGVVGPRLEQLLEQGVGAGEEHLLAGAAGRVAQGTGQEGLAHADRSHEDHVLAPLHEAHAEQLADPVAVEGDRGVPVEVLEGLLLGELRLLKA